MHNIFIGRYIPIYIIESDKFSINDIFFSARKRPIPYQRSTPLLSDSESSREFSPSPPRRFSRSRSPLSPSPPPPIRVFPRNPAPPPRRKSPKSPTPPPEDMSPEPEPVREPSPEPYTSIASIPGIDKDAYIWEQFGEICEMLTSPSRPRPRLQSTDYVFFDYGKFAAIRFIYTELFFFCIIQ